METANWLLRYLREHLHNEEDKEKITAVLLKAFEGVNEHLYHYAKENKKFGDMGTTAVVAYIIKDNYYCICHIGDSRVYLIKENSVEQLTKDHSYVQKLLDMGEITIEEANHHPKRNVITQAIGSKTPLVPEVVMGDFKDGEYLLMCTDGLSENITSCEITQIIDDSPNLQAAAERLVKCAAANGGLDDTSVILIGKKHKQGDKGERI